MKSLNEKARLIIFAVLVIIVCAAGYYGYNQNQKETQRPLAEVNRMTDDFDTEIKRQLEKYDSNLMRSALVVMHLGG